jgi:hypothetical protein
LANLRGRLKYPDLKDLFFAFFPRQWDEGREAATFLLEHTRHTPRDFLQLLKYVQHFAEGDGLLTRDQVLSGMREYSIKYFLPELRDELVGSLDPESIQNIFQLIASLKSQTFFASNAQAFASQTRGYKNIDLDAAFSALYECSAVGHIYGEVGKPLISFKYRNRDSSFNPSHRLIIHRGLFKAIGAPSV